MRQSQRTRLKKLKPPKAVSYQVIPQESDSGKPLYELLYSIVDTHHQELSNQNVRIVLAWATSWKPDVDGRMTLGKCKKASDLDRELAPFDFVILLNKDFWLDIRVTDVQRTALLDHELMHAAIAYDEQGEPKVDERGRTVYRIRKHDLEEFSDIAARYGCWKRDIEAFAAALERADRGAQGWVGYSKLQQTLKSIGLTVATDVIATWPETERREVLSWALVRESAGEQHVSAATSQTIPACLAAALRELTPSSSSATH